MYVYKTPTVNMHNIKDYSGSGIMRCSEQSYSCRMGVPVTSTRQEKEMKRMPSGQEEMKLPLLAEEMTVYIDISKELQNF